MGKIDKDKLKYFNKIKIDSSWSFADKTRKDTAYITHGYHRYPAKFIPQIVSRLVKKYTQEGDLAVESAIEFELNLKRLIKLRDL